MESKTKTCQNCKSDFTIEPEDFEFYKKIDVPEPTWCPVCRMKRRMIWRNERNLFKKKDDFSGEMIFSNFPPESYVKVIHPDTWHSDKWDPMKYGRDYDFNKPFFEQFKELIKEIPLFSRAVINMVNSDFCMNAGYLKNCYLIFNSAYNEDCAYGVRINYSEDCYDNVTLDKCELCYNNFMLAGCYKTLFSSYCDDCQEVIFCKNCTNCQNCFGCTNLKHKKYHIFNKEYTKKEYEEKLKEFNIGSYKNIQELQEKAKEHHLKYPNRFMTGRKNVNVTGDYINNSKNVKNAYSIRDGEDLKYCQLLELKDTKDCYDQTSFGKNVELVYEGIALGLGVSRLKFCYHCYDNVMDLEYCIQCPSASSNLFGCIGIKKKQYCILNKQYTEKEYEEMIPKIKKHMNDMPYTDKRGIVYKYGEFFPIEISPLPYNRTITNEFHPLTKEQALEQGYIWQDRPKSEHEPTIQAQDLPDDIKYVNDNILNEVIGCGHGQECIGPGAFKLIPQELKFLKKMNLPLPRFCPDCRQSKRMNQQNPIKLWHRKCMKKGCNTEFETSYSPDRKEIVYCEECYLKEVG